MRSISASAAALLFVITLSMAAPAETFKKSVTLPNAVEVNGKTLPAGDYKVKVDATGSSAQVTFLKGGKEVASAPAQLKVLPAKQNATQVQINTASSTPRLDEIDFIGTTTGIKFATNTASAGE